MVAAVAAEVEQEALTDTLWLSSLKLAMLPVQEKPLLATTWMDLEGIMLSEISCAAKDKYCMISLMWNLKNTTN